MTNRKSLLHLQESLRAASRDFENAMSEMNNALAIVSDVQSKIAEMLLSTAEAASKKTCQYDSTKKRILRLVEENRNGVPLSDVYRRCQAWHKLSREEREQVLGDLENSGKIVLRRSTPDGGLGRSITRIYPPEDY